jgi:hypothetical protein
MVGQTYFQSPDLIDYMVRSKVSRKQTYPFVPLPDSSWTWTRPSHYSKFPANIDLSDDRNNRLIQRASITHLSLISRSSSHQAPHNMSQAAISTPALNQMIFQIPDHAKRYLGDKIMTALGLHECRRPGAKNFKTVFLQHAKVCNGVTGGGMEVRTRRG